MVLDLEFLRFVLDFRLSYVNLSHSYQEKGAGQNGI